MPRWKALPDELDPQIKEFTSQLRLLVDRSGMGVAALADRTGYSRTSWERYLAGRLLAPKGAIVALAEVTGTHPGHLTTMWELAERAWSRAEMRRDPTAERSGASRTPTLPGESVMAAGAKGASWAARGSGATAPDAASPAGALPAAPPRPPAAETVEDGKPEDAGTGGTVAKANSWGVAGYQGPSTASRGPGAGSPAGAGPDAGTGAGRSAGARTGTGSVVRPSGPGGGFDSTTVLPASHGVPPQASRPAGGAPGGGAPGAGAPGAGARAGGGRGSAGGGAGQRLTMFLAGFGTMLVLIGAVFLFTHRGDADGHGAAASPSPSATVHRKLPHGVKCAGTDCDGKDAEAMGCSGEFVTTVKTATVGAATLEVRYSKACGAAWGRITGGAQGDQVRVTVGGTRQAGDVATAGDTIAYTPMVAVKDASGVKACAILAAGQKGCTT
ncbi:DUF2690 domain-containing protein [Streptomyces sp. NPDC005573]|uniref:helix-turn-helix domain-containing protein n=1 Tax=Streptomyces sp. NPDC005573 TaxID=3156890 RepID=UPI0033BCE97C